MFKFCEIGFLFWKNAAIFVDFMGQEKTSQEGHSFVKFIASERKVKINLK